MRVLVRRKPLARILRWTQRALFGCAFLMLGYCAFVMTDSWMFQRREKLDLENILRRSRSRVAIAPTPASPPAAGDLIGQLDVDRLGVSVAVIEGSATGTLERAAGHVTGTALPGESGNMAIAAHRDTFFRPLRNIRADDLIRLTTPRGTFRYRVVSTKIVDPDDVAVLDPDGSQILTLVTCYPFYYVGAAPYRFIVRAERMPEPEGGPDATALQPKTALPHPKL